MFNKITWAVSEKCRFLARRVSLGRLGLNPEICLLTCMPQAFCCRRPADPILGVGAERPFRKLEREHTPREFCYTEDSGSACLEV